MPEIPTGYNGDDSSGRRFRLRHPLRVDPLNLIRLMPA